MMGASIRARIRAARSKPVMSGSMMSSSTTSGVNVSRHASVSSPEPAVATTKRSDVSTSRSSSQMPGSSSTARARSGRAVMAPS
jgi:hypothetical protein